MILYSTDTVFEYTVQYNTVLQYSTCIMNTTVVVVLYCRQHLVVQYCTLYSTYTIIYRLYQWITWCRSNVLYCVYVLYSNNQWVNKLEFFLIYEMFMHVCVCVCMCSGYRFSFLSFRDVLCLCFVSNLTSTEEHSLLLMVTSSVHSFTSTCRASISWSRWTF